MRKEDFFDVVISCGVVIIGFGLLGLAIIGVLILIFVKGG